MESTMHTRKIITALGILFAGVLVVVGFSCGSPTEECPKKPKATTPKETKVPKGYATANKTEDPLKNPSSAPRLLTVPVPKSTDP